MQSCDDVDVDILAVPEGAAPGRIARAPGRIVVVPVADGDVETALSLRGLADAELDASHLAVGGDMPGYALIVTSRSQIAVFVHGPVAVSASGGSGELRLEVEPGRSGAYLLPPDCAVVVVTAPGRLAGETEPAVTVLADGIATGGGARLHWAAELPPGHAAEVPATTPRATTRPAESVAMRTGSHPNTQPIPVVMAWDSPATAGGVDAAVQNAVMVPPPAPSAGMLRCDTGAAYLLDADVVVGRDPSADPAVMNGWARPLVLADYGRLISRIHAQIVVRGTQVLVMDRGSTNGTSILPPGTTSWSRLAPNTPVPVAPGTLVSIGNHTLRIDAH